MPLDLTSPIMASDIAEIRMLKANKIYLLQGWEDDAVVIKGEDYVGSSQIKSNSVAVKAIDAKARMKVLSATEVQELKTYCKHVEAVEKLFKRMRTTNGISQDHRAAVADLVKALGGTNPFAKMLPAKMTTLQGAGEQFYGHGDKGDKSGMRTFVKALKAEGGLEKLGMVVAGDLFNSNNDRFSPGSGMNAAFHPRKDNETVIRMKALVNPGNVILVADESGKLEVSMLDYCDPFTDTQLKNPNQSVVGAEGFHLNTLADKALRKQYAADIISDLELLLNPHKSRFSLFTKLGRNAPKRLEAGMIEGSQRILKKLEAKYNPNRWPLGMKERYVILSKVKA